MKGAGKPEPLSVDLQGEYSRCINEKDRLVYHMENGRLYIAHCSAHTRHHTSTLPPPPGETYPINPTINIPPGGLVVIFPYAFIQEA